MYPCIIYLMFIFTPDGLSVGGVLAIVFGILLIISITATAFLLGRMYICKGIQYTLYIL